MRWATYRSKNPMDSIERVGLVEEDVIFGMKPGIRLVDLFGDDGSKLREAGEKVRRSPDEVRALKDAILLSPIPHPPTVRDFVSFEQHHRTGIQTIGQAWDDSYYELPSFYFTNANAMFGSDQAIRFAGNTKKQDFELEICAVIGREGIDLDPDEAESYIAGYCIFNDWSARDIQADEMARIPIGPAKGKDSAMSMGPYLVTPDELEDRRQGHGFDLAMKSWINGKPYTTDANWSSIYWSFGEMLSYASRNAWLAPGDVLAAGTVSTGCVLELGSLHGWDKYPWLKEGDEVVLEIERLGQLRNRVTFADPPKPIRNRISGGRVDQEMRPQRT
jgi:2-keto-4-pentenoate hydratase/2-oxohepta-3-ene-1,7-dioic acid hydratase in catechol pathway